MDYFKIGLIISTVIIFSSIVLLQYDILELNTVIDVFIIPAFIVNISLVFKVFKNKKQITN
ncbi:hypothetical protein MBM09_00700 [Flaviramulus sp. BrNp1-15]|uniref:hypothetical protein n=1 Tax=Flaviramulus sp. BrNp1-15 TaxID=2916754 RepID=UPI001EE87792|nr:hypothetical protein [Flaviramulus sp. BrNp1-15]ULC59512.1 hypothetical protein MBM09_00700 [Flaviramulus sp. BrNp1-15]